MQKLMQRSGSPASHLETGHRGSRSDVHRAQRAHLRYAGQQVATLFGEVGQARSFRAEHQGHRSVKQVGRPELVIGGGVEPDQPDPCPTETLESCRDPADG